MTRALVILAEGAEEMEVVIAVDVLRRGGVEVLLAGLEGNAAVACSRGLRLLPDLALGDARGDFDVVILPGGREGARRLAESTRVRELLGAQEAAGRWIAAICAAPLVLSAVGVGRGKAWTSHPGVRRELSGQGVYREEAVVVDGRLVTSRAPGTAFAFALKLVELLEGGAKAREVAGPMLVAHP